MSPFTTHSPDLCSQRGRVGLADLQHSRTAREGGRCVFLTHFLGSLDNGKKAALACVHADLGCHGLSPCVVPGGGNVQTSACSTVGAVRKTLHLWAPWGIGSLRRVLLPGSAKEAKTYLNTHCTKADVKECDLIQNSEWTELITKTKDLHPPFPRGTFWTPFPAAEYPIYTTAEWVTKITALNRNYTRRHWKHSLEPHSPKVACQSSSLEESTPQTFALTSGTRMGRQ